MFSSKATMNVVLVVVMAAAAASTTTTTMMMGCEASAVMASHKNNHNRRKWGSPASSSLASSSQHSSYFSFLDDEDDIESATTSTAFMTTTSKSRRSMQNGRFHNPEDIMKVEQCSSTGGGMMLAKNIVRGALLRIASDMSGGTPLESIKCRVTVTHDNMIQAYQNIVKDGGITSLWTGTPSRTVEGAFLGAFFILGSSLTKKQVLKMGGSKTMAALLGGTVGGVAQAVVMTPAGMIFTSLNVNKGKRGYENDNALTVARRIIKEKGITGLFYGGGPMCIRQASNWASRAGFTEICRTNLRMSQYGVWGEIGSGVIGGVGSCWNTPIETIRVLMQRDVSMGKPSQPAGYYWNKIVEEDGYAGLFRGVTPRAIQAIWQTVFMVVVPNMLGI
mmetsp:Transcript_31688/g.76890  ORF Transcript_31688/g.76890 Transcript_31688/m.76890 type:complete len:390 (+) Transcript_31688:187-1356(+)